MLHELIACDIWKGISPGNMFFVHFTRRKWIWGVIYVCVRAAEYQETIIFIRVSGDDRFKSRTPTHTCSLFILARWCQSRPCHSREHANVFQSVSLSPKAPTKFTSPWKMFCSFSNNSSSIARWWTGQLRFRPKAPLRLLVVTHTVPMSSLRGAQSLHVKILAPFFSSDKFLTVLGYLFNDSFYRSTTDIVCYFGQW